MLSGSARGARKRPAQVGTTPMRTSGRPNRAVRRDATTRSQASDDLEAAAQGGALDGGDQRLAAPPPDDAVLAAPGR